MADFNTGDYQYDTGYNPFAQSGPNSGFNTGDMGYQMQYGGGPSRSSGPGLGSLMGMFAKGPNPLVSAGISLGTSLLGGLGRLIGGNPERDYRMKVANLAQNRLGQNVLDPQQYMADYMRSQAPRWNQQSAAIDQRLGLDSGAAQSERMGLMEGPLAQFMLQAKQQNDIMKSQRDQNLLSLMASLGR